MTVLYEIDDLGIRIVGYNDGIAFYDPERNLQATICLLDTNELNISLDGNGGGGGGGGALTPHALDGASHVGTLASSQGPQFVLLDGSRALTGNLDAGGYDVTNVGLVDGVDVSAHAARHHNGGGDAVDHDSLSGFVADEHVAHSGVSVIAGSGLTGGGTIAASRTLNVGAGDGIDVAADSIAVDVTDIIDTSSGLGEDALNNIVVKTGNGIEFDGSGNVCVGLYATWSGLKFASALLLVDLAANFSWTGTHSFTSDIQADCNLDFIGAQSITCTTDLTVAPTGDLLLDPTGHQVKFANWNAGDSLESSNYVSQTTGWAISYGSTGGHADFRSMYADELHVKAFIADIYSALAGGMIITKSRAKVSRDFTIPNTSSSATLYVEDLEGWPDTQVFAANDYVCLRVIDRSGGGLVVADVYGTVTGYTDDTGGEQHWTFTTTTPGYSSADKIYKGSIVLDYGQTGSGSRGIWEVTVLDAAGAPYSQVQTWSSIASGEPSGFTTHVRMGNLDGISGIGLEYGLFAGEGVSAGDSYLLLSDQHAALHNIELALYDSSNTQRIGMNPDVGAGEKMMWMGHSIDDPGLIVYGDGDMWLSTLAISGDLGEMLFSSADGLALWGPGCELSTTGWIDHRRQTAARSGAFNVGPGRWSDSRAWRFEKAITNLVANPSFETNLDSWTTINGGTWTRDASGLFGDYALKGVVTSTTYAKVYSLSGLTPGQTLAISASYRATVGSARFYVSDGDYSNAVYATANATSIWMRDVVLKTVPASGAVKIVLFAGALSGGTATIYFDGVQAEANQAFDTSYADGSLGLGYAWTGTAHASTSTRTATSLSFSSKVIDPASGSIAIWFQMPCDAGTSNLDATRGLFYWWDAWNTESLYLQFGSTMANITLSSYSGSAANPSVSASLSGSVRGDWHQVIATWDTGMGTQIFLDGVLADSDGSFAAPSIASATAYVGIVTAYSGCSVSEFALLGRPLTAGEASQVWALQRPLVDAGAVDKPGIYILDGRFSLASSSSGSRLLIDEGGIAAYSAESGNPQSVAIDVDGDVFFGANISAAATTALGVFANAQTYNSESMGAGDVLLGDNTASKANILWDKSTGQLKFRGGTTTHTYIDTSGALSAGGGVLTLSSSGLKVLVTTAPSDTRSVQFVSSGTTVGRISGYDIGSVIAIVTDIGSAVIDKEAHVAFNIHGGSNQASFEISLSRDVASAELIWSIDSNHIGWLYIEGMATVQGLAVKHTASLPDTGQIKIGNGTAPGASISNGVILFAEDVSSSSELKVRDEAGNVTTLSPHDFSLIPGGPSEEMAWSFHSERHGRRINVDMLRVVRLVEMLSDEQLVYIIQRPFREDV